MQVGDAGIEHPPLARSKIANLTGGNVKSGAPNAPNTPQLPPLGVPTGREAFLTGLVKKPSYFSAMFDLIGGIVNVQAIYFRC